LRRVYRAIDSAIGEVLAHAGHARVILFTAHGMAHRYGAQFLLRDILVRLGVTVPDAPAGAGSESAGIARRIARGAWRRLPESVRRPLQPLRRIAGRARSRAARTPSLRVDVERSRCFPVGNGLAVGGIRLNLAGREPNGFLRPGAEADAFCAQLAADLMGIVDDRTGRPLVRRVVRTRALYSGDQIDALPDLLVEWDDATPLESTASGDASRGRLRARSDRIGVVEGVNDYARTGEHRPGGWMVAAGPGIAAGRLDRTVSLLDLAPSACAMLGVELDDIDGRAIPELAGVPDEDRRGNR
jgi:predicted AlkP superfamily phosphohydrolase/phosphomutase